MKKYVKQSNRQIRFNELDEKVFNHAVKYFEGNINMAVRDLIKKGLEA